MGHTRESPRGVLDTPWAPTLVPPNSCLRPKATLRSVGSASPFRTIRLALFVRERIARPPCAAAHETASRRRKYNAPVSYDEGLAERLRELLAGERGLAEKKMFGGLAFLIGGNMAIAASGQGGVLVRVDPAKTDELVGTTNAEVMVMRGRSMHGWLRVAPEHLRTKRQFAKWSNLAVAYARSLPVKHEPMAWGTLQPI